MENKGDERIEELELEIEETIGLLYSKLYELRQLGEYQKEYDILGTLSHMLIEDRQFLRENYRSQLGE
jgi:hypothetical protein